MTNRATLDPVQLAHRYDPERDAVHFVRADREERRRIAFLTDEYLSDHANPAVVARTDALARMPATAPIHFVFHSAYCCSTLLANVLDIPGTAATLKEPVILNDLVGWRHRGGEPSRVGAMLDASLNLLARPFVPGEAVIVKPSNVVNGLARAMLALRQDARAVLLYAPLPIYLGSIAGKGLWGRRWVRELLLKQVKDQIGRLGFTPDDYFLLSDLQVAAVGWLAQHQLFADLARPADALAAIGDLFALELDAERLADSEAFRHNAKDGSAYGRDARLAGQRDHATLHADEIDKVLGWADAVARNADVAMVPPSPLLRP